jgi:hypothetical protein
MTDPKLSELMKRDKKLQAILGQRELTQDEKDEWENLVRQITELQEEA